MGLFSSSSKSKSTSTANEIVTAAEGYQPEPITLNASNQSDAIKENLGNNARLYKSGGNTFSSDSSNRYTKDSNNVIGSTTFDNIDGTGRAYNENTFGAYTSLDSFNNAFGDNANVTLNYLPPMFDKSFKNTNDDNFATHTDDNFASHTDDYSVSGSTNNLPITNKTSDKKSTSKGLTTRLVVASAAVVFALVLLGGGKRGRGKGLVLA